MNNGNLSKEQMDALLGVISKESGADKQAIMNDVNSGDIKGFANKHLKGKKKEQVQSILNDEQKLKEVLSSPKAQELFKKFSGK